MLESTGSTENVDYRSEGNGMDKVDRPDAEGLLSKAVIISFKTGRFGNNRKVRRSQLTISAVDLDGGEDKPVDKDVLKVSKELLDSKELQAIGSFDQKTRGKLLTYCLPSYVDEGYYFLPISLIETVDAFLATAKAERRYLVNGFMAVYPGKKGSARYRLGPLFRERDYPGEDEVRATFTWSVRYISFSVPGSLRDISMSLFLQEKERQERMWEEATVEVRVALRESMAGLVEHAISKLSLRPNGKPQIFRDSMVKNMAEFLDLFDKRNLTNDGDLAALVGQAKQLMAGVDPVTLRNNLGTRERVKAGFEGIKATMDTMLIDRPVRQIDLDD
jgi:hypothetical protein